MTSKNTINLLDYALGVKGPEPVTINVGDDVEITLRRAHTGAQILAYEAVEQRRVDRAATVLASKQSDGKKAAEINGLIGDYTVELLDVLCTEDTDAETRKQAAERIVDLPAQARQQVFRSIGFLAGVVDEDGNPTWVPASETRKSTRG